MGKWGKWAKWEDGQNGKTGNRGRSPLQRPTIKNFAGQGARSLRGVGQSPTVLKLFEKE
ncbi:MAG: hypothetical protein FWG68_09805 [Defluviitaleaceae bacterium]|nr:hypothetical protein [Defluviitaleaceae bacterium]